ncbi:SPOR domain-containing protein [Methylomarinum sp. Ch1-1]|uniref:SPOR domain-containing protein n=1 Tax=Methylomarinum roseum TaxID=3067653 RepID=A0AAU7NPR2_9GAMM
MADSSENNKTETNKLVDDFDSMLDESEKSTDRSDELIDDEDAIDRLLMDNAFDSPIDEEEDEFAEIDELIGDGANESPPSQFDDGEEEVDEFADDEPFVELDGGKEQTPEDAGIDEFAEQQFDDELAAQVEDADEFAQQDEPSDQTENTEVEQDFMLSDFDISADEAEVEEDWADQEEQGGVDAADSETKQAPLNEKAESDAAIAAIHTQLAALQSAQEMFRQQLAAIEHKEGKAVALTEEMDELSGGQKKMSRKVAALEQQKPVFAYAALAVAILALLLGGGLGIVGFSANSRTADLSQALISLEEQVDAWIARDNNSDQLNSVSVRLDRMDSEVARYSAQITELNKQMQALQGSSGGESLDNQLTQLAERNMQTGAVLEALQQKVDELESKNIAAVKKTPKKAPVVKQNWVVNLVSFKQQWYAKRKAAEFEKQGVPVEVMNVEVKGEDWFRLRVTGFQSKYKAAAYAAKVKKTLNLSSVWVTKDG